MHLNSKVFLLLTAGAVCVLMQTWIFFGLTTSTVSHVYYGNIRFDKPNQYTGVISGKDAIEQSFIADEDRLSAVDVYIATYARDNTSTIIFELFLEQKKVGEQIVPAQEMENDAFYRFAFPVQDDAKGKQFLLKISSVDSTATNGVTARYRTPKIAKEAVDLYIHKQPIDGTLYFVPQHQATILQRFHDIAQKIELNKGGSVPVFFVYSLAAVLLLTWNSGILYWLYQLFLFLGSVIWKKG